MSTMHRSKGGVQSEISMWENRVFESRSAQCHAATSWIDGGGRGAGTTATSWNDGEELDRHRSGADGAAAEKGWEWRGRSRSTAGTEAQGPG
jgi:hypothetical protein